MSGKPPPKLSTADALDRLLYEQHADEIAAMSSAELDAELERNGYDDAALDRAIARAFEAADLPGLAPAPALSLVAQPAQESGPPAASGSRVADLQAARTRKAAATTRWGLLAAAAAVALAVGGGGAQLVARWTPTPSVTYPTQVPGPSPQGVWLRN